MDWAPLACTGTPPVNACGYAAAGPSVQSVITGSTLPGTGNCTIDMTDGLTEYGRRCHLVSGLVVGDTIQFRWRFSSDPGA